MSSRFKTMTRQGTLGRRQRANADTVKPAGQLGNPHVDPAYAERRAHNARRQAAFAVTLRPKKLVTHHRPISLQLKEAQEARIQEQKARRDAAG